MFSTLQWLHNECYGVSNHRSIDCLLFTQPFVQAQIKLNIKAQRHWPLWGELTGDRWIPRTKGSNAKMFPFDDVVMRSYNTAFCVILKQHHKSWQSMSLTELANVTASNSYFPSRPQKLTATSPNVNWLTRVRIYIEWSKIFINCKIITGKHRYWLFLWQK